MRDLPSLVQDLTFPVSKIETESEAYDILSSKISCGSSGFSVAINAEKIYRYWRDEHAFASTIDSSSLKITDGVGASWAARLIAGQSLARVDFPRLALQVAVDLDQKVFFAGATDDVNRLAIDGGRNEFADINIIGGIDGYQSDEALCEAILTSGADIVLLGLEVAKTGKPGK